MTVLVIGGAYQGKRTQAKRLFGLSDCDFVCGESCTADALAAARAVDGLHRYMRRMPTESLHPLVQMLRGKVILCDEIGSGVIPIDKAEDDWRERTGRLCCLLAERAELVVRVQAGIAQAIKGSLPDDGE